MFAFKMKVIVVSAVGLLAVSVHADRIAQTAESLQLSLSPSAPPAPVQVPVPPDRRTFAEGNKPVWTIEALAGKANSHRGANCFSSVFAVKGYDDELAYVGSKQMEFYLNKFCSRSPVAPAPGDIFVVTAHEGDIDVIAHTALVLEDGLIFEKESGDGLYSNVFHMNPTYQVKKMSESYYVKNRKTKGYSFAAYRCQSAKFVREQMKTCEAKAEKMGINAVRREYQKMMVTPSREITLSAEALQKMKTVAAELRQVPGSDPCLEYLMAMSESVSGAIRDWDHVSANGFSEKAFGEFSQREAWSKAADDIEAARREAFDNFYTYQRKMGILLQR